MSTLNWGDLVKEAGDVGGFDPLPDGDYDLTIVEAQAKATQTGKTMFAIKAQVQTGAHAKRLVWDNLVVSTDNPAALGIFFRKMNSLGLGREFFATSPSNAHCFAAAAAAAACLLQPQAPSAKKPLIGTPSSSALQHAALPRVACVRRPRS